MKFWNYERVPGCRSDTRSERRGTLKATNWLGRPYSLGIIVASWLLGGFITTVAQPFFLFQPQSQSVSTKADVILLVVAYGPEPVSFQWWKDGTPVSGGTDSVLALTSVVPTNAGGYWVVASISSGSVTSDIAILSIDSTFSKITDSVLVKNGGTSWGAAWGDYDNDGFLDLFVAKVGTDVNHLYRNNGDGSFTRVNGSAISSEIMTSLTGSWVDFDNDGYLDLFVANSGTFPNYENDALFHNNGDGTFTRLTNTVISADGAASVCSAWADYDKDGFVDLFVGSQSGRNFLYRNMRDGSFTKVATNRIATDSGTVTISGAWADYDNDNDPDLLIANALVGTQNEYLYRNDGSGSFQRIMTGPLVTSGGNSFACAWADFDNDLNLDIFIANSTGQKNFLYRNNGDGSFTPVRSGPEVDDQADSVAAAWGDYDNDGFLDLFVANQGGQNFLYHNNGDGTFSKIITGSPVNDVGTPGHCLWADYDNDGFIDLFVTNLGGDNFLYHNNGNSNHWITIQCIGGGSNRSAIGTKIKLRTRIQAQDRWQMREIAARDGSGSPNSLRAEFGLGDATNIDFLQIEWPTGIIQPLENIAVNQFLTLREPPSIRIKDGSISEGDIGTRQILLDVYLTAPVGEIVSVQYFTVPGSALEGVDFISTNGIIIFAPGQTNLTIAVGILGDLIPETNKTFSVRLTNATTVPIAFDSALVTIINDDPVTLIANGASILEGDLENTSASVALWLSKSVSNSVIVDFTTADGTAVAGLDYLATNGTVVFNPGETSKVITVTVLGDLINELNETFFINLTNVVGVPNGNRQVSVVVVDNDPLPAVSIKGTSVIEGDTGTNHATFSVVLSRPSTRLVSVRYLTVDGTATSGIDYVLKSGSVTFTRGVTNQNIFVVVKGDITPEINETFTVRLINPSNCVLANDEAVGIILDDDLRFLPPFIQAKFLHLRFLSMGDQTYRVEWSSTLNAGSTWLPLAGATALLGNGGIIDIAEPIDPGVSERFYRVVLVAGEQ